MICGKGYEMIADGDKCVYEAETHLYHMVDCRECLPNPRVLGTPISQLSGTIGEPGYEEFCRIARSWGYD